MHNKRLPNKLHSLLALALSDLDKVEKDKSFVVNMNEWATKEAGDVCHVCLAGSVLVKVLKKHKL